jgi:hypothetical protein
MNLTGPRANPVIPGKKPPRKEAPGMGFSLLPLLLPN